jgi:HNH endonuclease
MGAPASFWAKTRFEDRGYRTPCIIFTGTIAGNGYGVVTLAGGQRKAHRVAYEAVNGPVPICAETRKPFPLDHLCRVRCCVNPDHLEPVTDGINVLRGISPHASNARKTHCGKGHEFTPENTRIDTAGHRQCRACRRAYEKKRHAARRLRVRALATQEVGR